MCISFYIHMFFLLFEIEGDICISFYLRQKDLYVFASVMNFYAYEYLLKSLFRGGFLASRPSF